jgi:hypothetical protein
MIADATRGVKARRRIVRRVDRRILGHPATSKLANHAGPRGVLCPQPNQGESIMRLGVLGVSLWVALSAVPAGAEILTVHAAAHVTYIDDPGNALEGQIAIGQTAQGTYSYETTVPDPIFWDVRSGIYPQTAQQSRSRVTIGSLNFTSDDTSLQYMYQVTVLVHYSFWDPDSVLINSSSNKPLQNGSAVDNLAFYFWNPIGVGLYSDALLTAAPNPYFLPVQQINITGRTMAGTPYTLTLAIDSAYAAPSLEASPASSRFVLSQHIEPAVIMKGGSGPISNLRGTVNGAPLPSSYLSQCVEAPSNSQGRVAMSCPDIVPFLIDANNHVEWSLDLPDTFTAVIAVDYEAIQ